MNIRNKSVVLLSLGLAVIVACGPSQEEINKKNKMRADSLAQAKEMIMRQDAIARAEQEAMLKAQEQEQAVIQEMPKSVTEQFNFGTKGSFAVQVESGRTPENLAKALKKWKADGFTNAYIAVLPGTQSNDTWYRLRLGKFTSRKEAKAAAKAVSIQYRIEAWADNASGEIPAQ